MVYRDEVAFKAASKVHKAWCQGELSDFYGRFVKALEGRTTAEALREACYKGGKVRNEVVIIGDFTIKNVEDFRRVIQNKQLIVKRFTARTLTPDEQNIMVLTGDYNTETGEENILRGFAKLSAHSQQDNLEAAENALDVYCKLVNAGMTVEEMKDPATREYIGRTIHTAWMERTPANPNNSYLFRTYENLGNWEKGQDLDVFDAVLATVEELQFVPERTAEKLPTDAELKAHEEEVIARALNIEEA